MLSIEKSMELKEVIDWALKAGAFGSQSEDDGLVACYKVDGSSCSLVYKDGELQRAVTRGDGRTGNDVTLNARRINGIQQKLCKSATFEVRGEIYLTLNAYEETIARQKLDPAKTNPRNLCAGTVIQNDPREVEKTQLSFMAHGCVGVPPGSTGKSEAKNLLALQQLGFEVPLVKRIASAEEIEQTIKDVDEKRDSLPYETDGIVFTINRIALHQELGFTSHHPRYRLAFKFGRDQGETSVVGIDWHTTRTGRVSPSMCVAPIRLGGAIVRLCTLHNAKFVQDMNIATGDTVLLEREVIPHIVKVTKKGNGLPVQCKVCGCELVWDDNKVNLLCPDLGGCPSQIHDFLCHYVSRGVTNMMGVGERVIAQFCDTKLVKSPADLYLLTEEEIKRKLKRQGDIWARNIVESIQSKREQTLETFLVSLGIKGLGKTVSARLANHFHKLEAVQNATLEELLNVENFAETMAGIVYNGLRERAGLITALLKHISLKEAEKVEGTLSGKSFCLTGHVEFDYDGKHYDARPDIEDLIKSKGGVIKSVSKALNYLVVGTDAGSKVEKAKKAGVTVIEAPELIKMLDG